VNEPPSGHDLLIDVQVLGFDLACAEQFGKVRGSLFQKGISIPTAPVPDSLVADALMPRISVSHIATLVFSFAGLLTSATVGQAAGKRGDYEQHALTHAGDAGRGRALFADEKLTKCALCHKVQGQGGDVGPDLSHIGGKFDRPHLVESLLEPSRQIVEGFRTSVIATVDGQTLTGIVREQSAETIVLFDAGGVKHVVPAAKVEHRETSPVSLMPQGLEELLTREQFTDLIAYLDTLRADKNAPFGAGTFQGKILRINPDGTVPGDNPFLAETKGKYAAIWARGLRNPFTFAVRPSSGELFINDVGGKFEELNVGLPGANYGWPVVEHGPTSDARFRGPVHWYPQASISGGAFAPADSGWPTAYRGRYFFADFVHGWIRSLDPDHPESVATFVSGLRRPVDLRFMPDGRLLVLLRNAWVIDDKFQPGTGTLLQIRPAYSSSGRD